MTTDNPPLLSTDSPSGPSAPAQLSEHLSQVFGFSAFRPGQAEVINRLLQGHSCLAIFPTGSGKSLCYQYVATRLRHVTLVVSPLLALIKDQLAFLHSKGIQAASIDSTLTSQQQRQIMQQIKNGECKILMVSVERFKNEGFRHFISQVKVSMLVIDEAHCISEWGHNFRPDYLKLPQYQQQLQVPLVLLLTATATQKVMLDMAGRFAISEENRVITGFYRNNLQLNVLAVADADKRANLLAILAQHPRQQSGIVYVTLQQSAAQLADFLRSQGLNAQAYHAGLSDDTRQQIQQQFMQQQISIIVATIAFGMGIDKSDIRFVIHYDLPKSIENYSQEIGRAGRDGQPAQCTVLANLDGLTTIENFVYGDTPDSSSISRVLDAIRTESEVDRQTQICNWKMQIHQLSMASNIRPLVLKTLLVQLELAGVIQPVYSYFAELKLRFIRPIEEILSVFDSARVDFLRSIFAQVEMKKIWGTLNFYGLARHSSAPRQRVIAALEYLAQQGHIELQTSQLTDVYELNVQSLGDPHLCQRLADYFAEKEHKEIARLAELVRFFSLDSCLSAALAAYFDDRRAPQHCGHCSVCCGKVATLTRSRQVNLPEPKVLKQAMLQLHEALSQQGDVALTEAIVCRFLTAMKTPLSSRLKLHKLAAYGVCETLPYAQVREEVRLLNRLVLLPELKMSG